ncbi:MAG TPA: hypothetical protein VEX86_18910 [Longimicrobium sp.]|nr:hypothetical protein [Longimicrobium sp.]
MKKAMFVAAAAAVLGALPANAQVFTPTFQSTARGSDIGLYLSDGPGELAIEGIWRRNFGVGDLGLRAGFADLADGVILLGVDWRQPLALGTAPLDVNVTLGAQGAFGDVNGVGGQIGLAVGHTFTETPGVRITPYIHPRVAVVTALADDADPQLEVLADLGADFDFSPNLSLRLGVNLGDGADWGIGLALRR